MRNVESAELSKGVGTSLVLIPAASPETKSEVLSIRFNRTARSFLEKELAGMGIVSKRDRMNFFRGAILAGIGNAQRANSPAWQKFIKAIQPMSKKILGMALKLDGAEDIMESGAEPEGNVALGPYSPKKVSKAVTKPNDEPLKKDARGEAGYKEFDLSKMRKPRVKLSPLAEASVKEGLKELAEGRLQTVSAAEAGAELRAAVRSERRKGKSQSS